MKSFSRAHGRVILFLFAGMTAFACGPLQRIPTALPAPPDGTAVPVRQASPTAGGSLTLSTQTQPPASATSTVAAPTAEAGSTALQISQKYALFPDRMVMGVSLAARDGRLWIGTLGGTIETLDTLTGTFGPSLKLDSSADGSSRLVFPVVDLAWNGNSLWALASRIEGSEEPFLFALDSESGEITHQWALDSTDWNGGEERMFGGVDSFGVSPGQIWVDGHIIETQTFKVTAGIPMPFITQFAYNGSGWMWMTGENGGACDDLLLVNADDPNETRCPDEWPFLTHTDDGIAAVGPGSPLALAGDRMWIGGGWSGNQPTYLLEAHSADLEKAMTESGPLASVPLLDTEENIRLIYAGGYLWLVYTGGDKAGLLLQLDAASGKTIHTLDLVGDEGRDQSDVPMDLAAEGGSLWVLTTRQLLRIRLP
jgi:hypothetical protein